MKTVCKENMCTGCMACLELCNKSAITIRDTLKEYNAVIDEKVCIDCGACHIVCQNNKEPVFYKTIYWHQGWSRNRREYSSSGGAATELITTFMNDGGTVCSCAFRDGKFGFYFAPDEVSVAEYIGSKYVKSSPEGIYKRIKDLLKENKKVLFLGLPCQVAAVKEFVGSRYQDNLFTVDLICHGSPSPKLLEMFLSDYGMHLDELNNITFRKKTKFGISLGMHQIEPPRVQDTYTFAFLNGLDYTENCYQCHYARQERVSDITIGDSWGSDLTSEENRGISLLLCQTEKGERLVQSANMKLFDVDYDMAVECNHQLRHPSPKSEKRDRFFERIERGETFKQAIAACYPDFYIKQIAKKMLIKLKIMREA